MPQAAGLKVSGTSMRCLYWYPFIFLFCSARLTPDFHSFRHGTSVRVVHEQRVRVVADVTNGSFDVDVFSIELVQGLGGNSAYGHVASSGYAHGWR